MAEVSNGSVYPSIFGVEEELWLTTHRKDEAYPYKVSSLEHFTALEQLQQAGGMLKPGQSPPLIYESPHDGPSMRQFNTSGSREYVDGLHAERATAESSSIREAIVRSRGVEQFAAALGQCLCIADPEVTRIVHNRRVGRFNGHLIGTQDSIYAGRQWAGEDTVPGNRIQRLLSAMALTRPYLTGAGNYDANGQFTFSQKLTVLANRPLSREGLVYMHPETGRIEILQNDINICDAAAMMRIGGAAIGATLAQTHLYDELRDFVVIAAPAKPIAGRLNTPALDPDGNFSPGENQSIQWAAEQHMRIAELFASRDLRDSAGEQPPELLRIAELIYETSDKMLSVLRGRQPISAIQDVSDWAAKHARRQLHGSEDYDSTIVVPQETSMPVIRRIGQGFTLRDSEIFAGGISQAEVDRLYTRPPEDTAALIRAGVIGTYVTHYVLWDRAKLAGVDEQGNPKDITITFCGSPHDTQMPESERRKLQWATLLDDAGLPSLPRRNTGERPSAGGDAVTEAIYRVIEALRHDP